MDDDLDDLLNDALSDFDKPPAEVIKTDNSACNDAPTLATTSKGAEMRQTEGATGGTSLQPPTEVFEQFFDKDISKRLQEEWESAMKELADEDPSLASHLQKLSTTLDNATDAAQAASTSAGTSTRDPGTATSPTSTESAPNSQSQPESIDLNKVMDATISGIEKSADELRNMSSSDAETKLMNELKNLGLGGNMSDMMGEMGDLGGKEGDFMAMMEGMMGNLLSKDVLYPTMKEISKAYPEWLNENEGIVPNGEFRRYKKQSEIIENICKSFEEEREDDSKQVKSQRLNVMMNLVEQMQECGNPPKELLEKCGGGSSSVDMGKLFGAQSGFDPNMFEKGDLNPDGCNIM